MAQIRLSALPRPPRIRGLRARLSLSVTLLVALAIAAMAVVFNVVLTHRLSSDANGLLRSRASGELAALRVVDGTLKLEDAPDDSTLDTQVWVFAGRTEVESPGSSPRRVRNAARRLAGGPSRRVELSGPDLRLQSVPVVRHGQRLGTVVAAVSLKPYEDTERTAFISSIILCVALIAFVLAMSRWTIARALNPVSTMTSQAARWSEADIDRRFDLGPPHDELTQLAATLDGLLERLAGALRHEQRFTAEISHELRTPLAKIRAEAEIALRRRRTPSAYRDALATVLSSAERMSTVVDTLLVAARDDSGVQRATCDAAGAATAAAAMCSELSARRGVTVRVNGSGHDVRVAADGELVERILFPLIENGCRYASQEVSVDIAAHGRQAVIVVRDDGPGVEPDEVGKIFDPGERGQAAGDSPGAGLGLALARRLARQVGGDVVAEAADGGRFTAQLPRTDS